MCFARDLLGNRHISLTASVCLKTSLESLKVLNIKSVSFLEIIDDFHTFCSFFALRNFVFPFFRVMCVCVALALTVHHITASSLVYFKGKQESINHFLQMQWRIISLYLFLDDYFEKSNVSYHTKRGKVLLAKLMKCFLLVLWF
jgi:hypothetical protein